MFSNSNKCFGCRAKSSVKHFENKKIKCFFGVENRKNFHSSPFSLPSLPLRRNLSNTCSCTLKCLLSGAFTFPTSGRKYDGWHESSLCRFYFNISLGKQTFHFFTVTSQAHSAEQLYRSMKDGVLLEEKHQFYQWSKCKRNITISCIYFRYIYKKMLVI